MLSPRFPWRSRPAACNLCHVDRRPYLLVLAVLALGGCSGGDEDAPAEASASERITREQLAVMPLPPTRLGPAGRGLALEPGESGYTDNSEAAQDTTDPEDDGGTLQAAGRQTGYDLVVVDRDQSSFRDGRGVVYAGSGVELFGTARQASAQLAKLVRDERRFSGMQIDEGVQLGRVRTTKVARLGDSAWAIESEGVVQGTRLHATAVAFTDGPLLGSVTVARLDGDRIRTQVEQLARELSERIDGVAAGTMNEAPVEIPGAELIPMALDLDDLPAGGQVLEETQTATSFARGFSLAAEIDGSQVVYVSSAISKHESEQAAQRTLRGSVQAFTGKAGAQRFAETFGSDAGVPAANVTTRSLRVPRIGDGSAALAATFETPLGRMGSVFVHVRVGTVVASLYATGPAQGFEGRDFVPLARRLAQKISAETA